MPPGDGQAEPKMSKWQDARRARRVALVACMLAAALVVIVAGSAANVPGLRAVEVPGMGWVVADEEASDADFEAALRNAQADDIADAEETRREIERDRETAEISLDEFDDEGPSDRVAAVKEAAPELVRGDLQIQASTTPLSEIPERVRAIYTSAVAPEQVEELRRILKDQREGDLGAASYTRAEVLVDDWRGVRVEDSRAVAIFRGHDRVHLDDGEVDERRYIWRLDLRYESGAWKMERLVFDDLDFG
jgi:hypothetical protein